MKCSNRYFVYFYTNSFTIDIDKIELPKKAAFPNSSVYSNSPVANANFGQFRRSLPLNEQIGRVASDDLPSKLLISNLVLKKSFKAKTHSTTNLRASAPKIENIEQKIQKMSFVENIGKFEKETRVMLKSNILTVRNMLENEITLEMSLNNEYGLESETKMLQSNSRESEIRKFIKSSTIPADELQKRLDKIKKDSKSESKMLEVLNIKSQEEALRVLFESISLIEILWNQMIAFETILVYKHQTKNTMFSRTSMTNMEDSFKSYENFRSRTLSYSKVIEMMKKFTEPDSGSYINRDLTLQKSISHFEPLSSNSLAFTSHISIKNSMHIYENPRPSQSLEPIKVKTESKTLKHPQDPISKSKA